MTFKLRTLCSLLLAAPIAALCLGAPSDASTMSGGNGGYQQDKGKKNGPSWGSGSGGFHDDKRLPDKVSDFKDRYKKKGPGKKHGQKDPKPDTPSPVPLPAGGLLLMGALGGLALVRRRKSQKSE